MPAILKAFDLRWLEGARGDQRLLNTGGTPSAAAHRRGPSQTRHARAQQACLPPGPAINARHPSYFGNAEQIPLTTPGTVNTKGKLGWVHAPLTPGRTTPMLSSRPGAVRSFYTNGDPNTFDVAYHDPTKPRRPGAKEDPFTMAIYHPAGPKPPPGGPPPGGPPALGPSPASP